MEPELKPVLGETEVKPQASIRMGKKWLGMSRNSLASLARALRTRPQKMCLRDPRSSNRLPTATNQNTPHPKGVK